MTFSLLSTVGIASSAAAGSARGEAAAKVRVKAGHSIQLQSLSFRSNKSSTISSEEIWAKTLAMNAVNGPGVPLQTLRIEQAEDNTTYLYGSSAKIDAGVGVRLYLITLPN